MKKILGIMVMMAATAAVTAAGGPIDFPASTEPRVEAAKCLTPVGFYASRGNHEAFLRVSKGDVVYSRDLLVALPGFKVELEPASKNVGVLLWGNLPELSSSPVLECAAVLHDTRAYDLDMTLLRGRVVLTNNRKDGAARIWLRTEDNAVELTLSGPGAQVAIEIYGRWPAGVPFKKGRREGEAPVRLWEAFVLKGELSIKAGRTTWAMTAPPGRAYMHGDNVHGPAAEGPQPVRAVPDWADPRAVPDAPAKLMAEVVATYRDRLKATEADVVARGVFALAAKEKSRVRAGMLRRLLIAAMAALDDVEGVAEQLGTSPHDEVRKTAVIALRHWIGARAGRDEKLYEVLVSLLHYTKNEADAILQMLHSPFNREQPETYETLIAFLRHRKQAVRELAHWHLVRLAPAGRDIPFDAAADAAARDKAAAEWRKLIPEGKVPSDEKK